MADPLTQKDHLIGIATSAGADVLLLDSFSGQEAISQPFRFNLIMVSELAVGNPAKVDPHKLVGTSMTVRIDRSGPPDGAKVGERYWTGFCERFTKSSQDENFAYYSAVLVPWFSFLNYATNCRIFQEKSAVDIIKEVVGVYAYSGLLDVSGLTKSYVKRDYCVQYRETDFAFLSRLMEDEGIYYYFEHKDGSHKMILGDSLAYRTLPSAPAEFKYLHGAPHDMGENTISAWQMEEKMHPGKWTARDFHHEDVSNRFERSSPSSVVAAEGKKFEAYDWAEDAKNFNRVGSVGGVPTESDKSVRVRMEKEEAVRRVINGVSGCCEFTSGYKVSVDGTDTSNVLVTKVAHRVYQRPAYGTSQERPAYQNHFDAIPADVAYVPQQVTGRTVVYGLQTAMVIDGSKTGGEEIWPDEFGRVMVRFHWDREAKYACWLRVVQSWGGNSWGHQWIPRVGDEVAVSFLEGDPDLPVIVGSVYNKTNKPMFDLPANKTQSGFRTKSSKGAGADNYNMLRFEDKKGSEEIFTQAEKDQNALIKNNETRTVKNCRTSTIHVNDSRTVETGQDTVTVQTGSRTVTVKQNITTEAQSGFIKVTADSNYIEVTSPTRITLTCGASKIEMTPSQITVTQGGSVIDLTSSLTTHTSPLIKLNS